MDVPVPDEGDDDETLVVVPAPPDLGLDTDGWLRLLTDGDLDVQGRLVDASNATLYCTITLDGLTGACVYKPVRGERPLWDFPDGTLAEREQAAFLVSEATGWDVVPATVLREGPFGRGTVQRWIDVDDSVDLEVLVRTPLPELRRIAVLDAVVNNADRKGGHLLPVAGGHVYGIDHGVCFSAQDKLRTLLWGWHGEPLPEEAVEMLSRLSSQLHGPLGEALHELLTLTEVAATLARVERLLQRGVHPSPSPDWPPIPWPPF